METNPAFVNGHRVFEGDMVLTESQWQALQERKAAANLFLRWSETAGYPLVPYVFVNISNINMFQMLSKQMREQTRISATFQSWIA